MSYFRDRIKETLTGGAPGTGNVTLNGTGATGGYNPFSTIPLNTYFKYVIVDNTNSLWETGRGYLTTTTNLIRDTPEDGSSGLATLVNFTSGTLDVFLSATAKTIEQIGAGHYYVAVRNWNLP